MIRMPGAGPGAGSGKLLPKLLPALLFFAPPSSPPNSHLNAQRNGQHQPDQQFRNFSSRQQLTVQAIRPLRFGTIVVIDQGSRMVHASGAVSDHGVWPLGSSGTGPAVFAISYDRRRASSKPISVSLAITLDNVPPANITGITGTLSSFETDLAGAGVITPKTPLRYTITGCTTQICTIRFHLGAQINVTRSSGSGVLTISPPVTATILAVRG